MKKRRVVVTGMGAITPIGNNVPAFWSGIKRGTVGIGAITKFDTSDYRVKNAAEVKDFVAIEGELWRCGVQSNYEIMKERMQIQFLEYDQTNMIEKFHLKHDERYLYITFVGHLYRIDRKNGKTEWSDDNFATHTSASYNEAMSIFDILCYSKEDCHLSGKFCNVSHLKGMVQSSTIGGVKFYHQIRYLDGKAEKLSRACELLGGEKAEIGDVSYYLYPFEFLPMILQFWNSDEEFPANLKIMWDENILDYVHFETSQFIISHVLHRIHEIMEREID